MLGKKILFLGLASCLVSAQPASPRFNDCFTGDPAAKLNVSNVYAQLLYTDHRQSLLHLTVFGRSGEEIIGISNEINSLATLFTSTNILTLSAFMDSSSFCESLRPPSPLPASQNSSTTYCPIPAGSFGFNATVPWGGNRELTSLYTRLRAVDPFGQEVICIDVATTPIGPERLGSPYGKAVLIRWLTVSLALTYWVMVGIARIVSAWNRGVPRSGPGWWSRVQSAGYILASAISGERLATSPALIRFATPSMRDIVFHTQWCAILCMVAVQWPDFVYPLLAQAAWSTLTYNVTLVSHHEAPFHHWDPLSVAPFNPPTGFSDQINDPNSPLFINMSIPNHLFTLPPGAAPGIESFAYTVGLRPQDLFNICLAIFLSIIAGTILLSLMVWSVDWSAASLLDTFGKGSQHNQISRLSGARSPRLGFSSSARDVLESTTAVNGNAEENRSLHLASATPRFGQSASPRKPWWRRTHLNSFHGSVLIGNLIRILVLFHLPVTIFSCYQMTLPRSQASLTSIVLAALSFVIFSIILPLVLVTRVTITTTNKLYDELQTLLSFGPLYNHYRHGSQLFASLFFATNFVFGVTIGCGQKSGTVQAIIILIVEVVSALVTSVWLPWGKGAGMGVISFSFCVARIVVAVLLVILTPTIAIGNGPGGWVAYGILVILALVYIAFLLMLVVKLIEAGMRLASGIGFDYSKHTIDSGLFGVCGLLGCCGPRQRRNSIRRRIRATAVLPSQISSFSPAIEAGVTKTHSGPPSVLRPEQALRPYREDSDDENGYIMGAWQPFPGPGYHPVAESPPAPPPRPSPVSTGFSRVSGGRAHFDSPYAITAGSATSFTPAGARNEFNPSPLGMIPDEERADARIVSSLVAARGQETNALTTSSSLHIRTKSQTAIVEDAVVLMTPGPPRPMPDPPVDNPVPMSSTTLVEGPSPPPLLLPPPPSSARDERPGSGNSQNRRRIWNMLRRPRPQSQDSGLPREDPLVLSTSPESGPGRSFVVIRDRRPQGASTSAANSDDPRPSTSPSSPRFRRPVFDLDSSSTGTPREWNATA